MARLMQLMWSHFLKVVSPLLQMLPENGNEIEIVTALEKVNALHSS